MIHHISIHVEHLIEDIFVNLWDVGGMKRLTLSLIVTYKQKFLYYCYSDDVDDNDDSSYFDWILVMMCSSCANRLHENCVHRWTDNTRGKLCATWSRHSETRFINLTVIPDEDKLTLDRNKRILQLWFSHSVLFIFIHALVVTVGYQRKQLVKKQINVIWVKKTILKLIHVVVPWIIMNMKSEWHAKVI